ncbi:MAG: metallophosphoesterase [Eubacteriales bacterium]|nr:metallophosphoesterase [Eubacteriales bacterium]
MRQAESGKVMRIGIVSDTHGDSYAIRRVIEQAGRVDAWIHLGDNTRDTEAFGKDGTPVYSVAGNCDFGGEKELRISLDGAEIFATHGHYYGVTAGTDRLAYRAEELGCNVALYGHTHIPKLDYDGKLYIINPGSPSCPRGGAPRTFAILTAECGSLNAKMMQL